jgi:hypothetical protein
VRIWDIFSHQQLYEFGSSNTMSGGAAAPAAAAAASCVTYHPVLYQVAVGSGGGLLQVFDVATTTLLQVGRGGESPASCSERAKLQMSQSE